MREPKIGLAPRQARLHEIIFEADTVAGRTFDLVLIVSIVLSVVTVMLDSVHHIEHNTHNQDEDK